MISYIRGTVKSIFNQKATIETDIGLGFEINLVKVDKLEKNQKTELFIYMHWNQENGPSLFGFLKEEEKAIFELIISCSGIGPKMGQSILSQIEPAIFISAIKDENTKILSSINGIGLKKAEQLIFHLKDKVSDLKNLAIINKSLSTYFDEISQVLASLSYSKSEITAAFNYLNKNSEEQNFNFDELLRKSLSFLSKSR